MQILYQLASSVTVSSYAFVMTLILCIIIDYIPGMGLRCSEEDEIVGIDSSFLGEETYDYVHLLVLLSNVPFQFADVCNYPAEGKQTVNTTTADTPAPTTLPTKSTRLQRNQSVPRVANHQWHKRVLFDPFFMFVYMRTRDEKYGVS